MYEANAQVFHHYLYFKNEDKFTRESLHCIVANEPNCDIVVNEFKLQLRNYVHFYVANGH